MLNFNPAGGSKDDLEYVEKVKKHDLRMEIRPVFEAPYSRVRKVGRAVLIRSGKDQPLMDETHVNMSLEVIEEILSRSWTIMIYLRSKEQVDASEFE